MVILISTDASSPSVRRSIDFVQVTPEPQDLSESRDATQIPRALLKVILGLVIQKIPYIGLITNKPVKNFRLTDLDDRKSIGGMCTYLGDTLISWASRSSTESEYRALADSATELKWLVSLLTEIGLPPKIPSMVWCDNLSAKSLAANPVQHARSKHIEIDVHFVRNIWMCIISLKH